MIECDYPAHWGTGDIKSRPEGTCIAHPSIRIKVRLLPTAGVRFVAQNANERVLRMTSGIFRSTDRCVYCARNETASGDNDTQCKWMPHPLGLTAGNMHTTRVPTTKTL